MAKQFDNPDADKNLTVKLSQFISFLEREKKAHGDVEIRICVPYADGIGFSLLPIKDVHSVEGRIDVLTPPMT